MLLLTSSLAVAWTSWTHRFPGESGYVDAESVTFPWVVNKKDLPPEEVKGLEGFIKDKYGSQS